MKMKIGTYFNMPLVWIAIYEAQANDSRGYTFGSVATVSVNSKYRCSVMCLSLDVLYYLQLLHITDD